MLVKDEYCVKLLNVRNKSCIAIKDTNYENKNNLVRLMDTIKEDGQDQPCPFSIVYIDGSPNGDKKSTVLQKVSFNQKFVDLLKEIVKES
mmetsp:Transcript_12749/g.17557  ORF Transcript_12749/g.17557 Transcript_12749/m.17557 type:complete len:90 (-) Transcript_12749:181-450(-)